MNRLASAPLHWLPKPKHFHLPDRGSPRERESRTSSSADVRGISVAEAMPAISRAVGRLMHGEALEVLSSDPDSVLVLLAWTYASGNPLLDACLEDDYRFVIQRGDRPMDTAAQAGARI